MNQYIITEEQKTPDNPLNYATMAILARIGKQAEFKEAWEKLENAERNYICGDIYNIVKSACSHPYQSERETILLSCIKSGNIIESREALEHLFNRHNTCKSERIRCPLCMEELRQAGE